MVISFTVWNLTALYKRPVSTAHERQMVADAESAHLNRVIEDAIQKHYEDSIHASLRSGALTALIFSVSAVLGLGIPFAVVVYMSSR